MASLAFPASNSPRIPWEIIDLVIEHVADMEAASDHDSSAPMLSACALTCRTMVHFSRKSYARIFNGYSFSSGPDTQTFLELMESPFRTLQVEKAAMFCVSPRPGSPASKDLSWVSDFIPRTYPIICASVIFLEKVFSACSVFPISSFANRSNVITHLCIRDSGDCASVEQVASIISAFPSLQTLEVINTCCIYLLSSQVENRHIDINVMNLHPDRLPLPPLKTLDITLDREGDDLFFRWLVTLGEWLPPIKELNLTDGTFSYEEDVQAIVSKLGDNLHNLGYEYIEAPLPPAISLASNSSLAYLELTMPEETALAGGFTSILDTISSSSIRQIDLVTLQNAEAPDLNIFENFYSDFAAALKRQMLKDVEKVSLHFSEKWMETADVLDELLGEMREKIEYCPWSDDDYDDESGDETLQGHDSAVLPSESHANTSL